MKKESSDKYISSEVLAAYLEGNATAAESREILHALKESPELREILKISQMVDVDLGKEVSEIEILPMTAMAASCGEENDCCLECEKYILHKRGIEFDDNHLLSEAIRNNWQKDKGTALHNMGRIVETKGLIVRRDYHCKLSDIVVALNEGADVIVAVDGGELTGNLEQEFAEDLFIGQIPDHALVVLSCDIENDTIVVHDPNSPHPEDTYSIRQFSNAWADSKNYLVTVNSYDMKNYIPKPINLSDVVLTEDLNELREAIAENAHEIWAKNRQAEGWTYGPKRNDDLKQTPDMVPYSKLTDSEKEYDRQMAMQTIKLLRKLGYDLVKQEDTELYKLLRERIRESKQEFHCPHCSHVVSKHQIFCDHCGHKLDIDWHLFD